MNARTHAESPDSIPLLKPGIKIAADSCSLIFLNKLRLLTTYAGAHTIILTQALYDEITRAPDSTTITDDRSAYKKILLKSVVSVHRAGASPANRCTDLSAADRSLIHAYETLKPDGILTDDKSLCRYCREHAIAYINTPMAIFALLYNGHLSHGQYRRALKTLYGIGRYGQYVRDYMQDIYNTYCARPG